MRFVGGNEEMVEQVVFQHKLNSFVKGLSSLVAPTLKLAAQSALVCKDITTLGLNVAAARELLGRAHPLSKHHCLKATPGVVEIEKREGASEQLSWGLDK